MNSDVSVPSVYGNACPGSFRPKTCLPDPSTPVTFVSEQRFFPERSGINRRRSGRFSRSQRASVTSNAREPASARLLRPRKDLIIPTNGRRRVRRVSPWDRKTVSDDAAMSTQRIRPHGAAAVAGILLFPLRAVEQARGWRRFVLLLVYATIALPIAAVGWRRSQLAGLPDVGNTFEVPAARPGGPVPDDRNPFVLYRQAAGRFRDLSGDNDDSFSKANFRWAWADAKIRRWVADNLEAVSLLRAGSERPEACLEQPGTPTDLLDPDGGTIVSRLLAICQVALFEAGRLRTEGDPAGAWAFLKAVVRTSRDIERAVAEMLDPRHRFGSGSTRSGRRLGERPFRMTWPGATGRASSGLRWRCRGCAFIKWIRPRRRLRGPCHQKSWPGGASGSCSTPRLLGGWANWKRGARTIAGR